MTPDPGRFDDRVLPADLFRRSVSGELSARDARRLAVERWEADERRGASMNDLVRGAVAGTSPDGRAERFQKIRDARGRFTPGEPESSLSMNDLIRARLHGGASAVGGTLDVSHLASSDQTDETEETS